MQCGAGASPFLLCPNGSASNGVTFDYNGAFNTGSNPVMQVDAGATTTLRVRDTSTIQTSSLTGGGAFTVRASADSTVSPTQPGITGSLTIQFTAQASQVGYAPGTAANWNPAPTLVNAALDQLAAPNFVQASGNTGTGTGTASATTGNIAKKKSAVVAVNGIATVTPSAGGNSVTVSLLRDATPIGGTIVLATADASSVSVPIQVVDVLPDTANHTYTCQATISAGTIAVPAGGIQIQAIEQN
jgi:hypothetical protein